MNIASLALSRSIGERGASQAGLNTELPIFKPSSCHTAVWQQSFERSSSRSIPSAGQLE
jgi:hypothetical protein